MQIKIKEEDIEWYKEVAPEFGKAIHAVANMIAGHKTSNPHRLIQEFITKTKEIEALRLSYPFNDQKNTLEERFEYPLCVSVNNCVAHGKHRVNQTQITKGDLVKIDGGISLEAPSGRKMFFDAAVTVLCGGLAKGEKINPLIIAPAFAIEKMLKLRGSINTRQLSKIIEDVAKEFNLGIITDLSGHGIGYKLHDEPFITNMCTPEADVNLVPGTFICPEPMYVENGSGMPADCYIDSDGWSVVAKGLSSHWETVLYYDGNKLIDVVGIIGS